MLILAELTLINTDCLLGEVKYKTENLIRDCAFEGYLNSILTECRYEEIVCR